MNIKTNIALLFPVFVLSACAAVSNGDESSSRKGVPYPVLNEQTQIDQLGIQVARLERSVNLLQTRIRQLERQGRGSGQRISDSKLKNNYLAKNDAAQTVADTDANETRLYDQAFKYYRSGNYTAAAAVLKGADGGNGSEISRKNMYLLLQSQQRLGNCESVINIGGRYANRFRNTAQAADAMYSIGQCQYKLQQKDIARDTWRKLIHTYPDSEAAKRAAVSIKQR